MSDDHVEDWTQRGKSIRELIRELQSFEDQDLRVQLSVDGGTRQYPIGLVAHDRGACVLIAYAIDSGP